MKNLFHNFIKLTLITIVINLLHHNIADCFIQKYPSRAFLHSGYQYKDKSPRRNVNLNLKRKKRQFGNTIFDSLGGINAWETLQNDEHQRIKKIAASDRSLNNDGIPIHLLDEKHGVAMGIKDKNCDDAQTKLEVDWDGSLNNYTCFSPKFRLKIRKDLKILKTCDDVPDNYIPQHYCMKDVIVYNSSLPTFGSHRPLWPIYGEYNFVPPQRWLHSIEHGSVVMLYHPCASPFLVGKLRELVTGCIYKHVISADNRVTEERPLVLISWGCKLEMSFVDKEMVKAFIRQYGLHGPEGKLSKQGHYDYGLITPSQPPKGSDINDTILCPAND